MNLHDLPGDAVATAQRAQALGTVLGLSQRARHARSAAELRFIAVNETHALSAYRQAALWQAGAGVLALSGVAAPEANAPYVLWLEHVAATLQARSPDRALRVEPAMLADADAAEWNEWLPAYALWLPLPTSADTRRRGPCALLLARDEPFDDTEIALLVEWLDHWSHAWRASHAAGASGRWQRWLPWSGDAEAPTNTSASAHRWWRDRRLIAAAITLAVLCIPVRLNVLAPGELVPAHPAVIRAPLEGTVDRFFVEPNATVKAGDKLFQLDLNALTSKLDVAQQALTTAEAEYRQQAQLAVFDVKSKGQLALLEGRIAARRTEAAYLREQLGRAQLTAPRDGIVLFDDPNEWIGKPVVVGERVMSVADPHDVEVEAWLAPGDAIELSEHASVSLYLNARPLSPVSATLRYAAHEASLRPDGSYAYRVRASLPADALNGRVGLKGTARISGHFVPLGYWVLRRPIAWLRQTFGW